MRKTLLPALALVLATGCGATDFDVTQLIAEQRVVGSPLPGPLATLFPLPLNIDIRQKIKESETGPIDSITLSSMTLRITATGMAGGIGGERDDWSFVDEIHVFVKSNKTDTTLPRVEIATAISPGATDMIEFDVMKTIDLQPYIEEGSTVEGESSGRLPEDDVTYDGQATFTVHPI